MYIVETDELDAGGLVTLSNSTVVAVWAEDGTEDYQVVTRRSTDAGKTWGKRQVIGHTDGDGEPLAATGRGDFVDVVFDTGAGIEYTRSTDRGATFSKSLPIPNCGISPSVARGANALVAISCWDTHGVSVAVSTDGGKSFGGARHVIDADIGVYMYAKVGAGKGALYLAFYDGGTPGNSDPPTLYVARSRDTGLSWSTRHPIARVWPDQDAVVSFAASGSHAYLSFDPADSSGASYIRTLDRGGSWSDALSLPTPTGTSAPYDTHLYLAGGVLRADFAACASRCSVYYAQSSDGLNWTDPAKVSNKVSDAWTVGVGYAGGKAVVAFGTGGFGGYYSNSRFYVRSGTP